MQTVRISIPETQVKDPDDSVVRMEREIVRKMASIAGVTSVALTSALPQDGDNNDPVYAEDHAYRDGTLPPIRRFKYISPGYLPRWASRLIAGRDLTWNETYQQTPVALVSENLAREFWRDPRAAIGKRIRPTPKDDWREVIGVIADLRDDGVDQKAPAIVYWPLIQNNFESRGTEIDSQRGVSLSARRGQARPACCEICASRSRVSIRICRSRPCGRCESIYDRSLARTSFTLVLLAIAGGMACAPGRGRDLRRHLLYGVAADARDRNPARSRRSSDGGHGNFRPARAGPLRLSAPPAGWRRHLC